MAGTSTRENGLKETVTLKWCTPRSNNIGGRMICGFKAERHSKDVRGAHLFCCFRAALLHRSVSHLPNRREQPPVVLPDQLSSQW